MSASWGASVVMLISLGGVSCSSCTLRLLIISVAVLLSVPVVVGAAS